MVDGGAGFGVGYVEDGFAERVEGDVDAFGVELDGGGDGFVDGHAGDEAAGDFTADGGAFRECAKGLVGRETNEKRTKQNETSKGRRRSDVSFSHFAVRLCTSGSVVARGRGIPTPFPPGYFWPQTFQNMAVKSGLVAVRLVVAFIRSGICRAFGPWWVGLGLPGPSAQAVICRAVGPSWLIALSCAPPPPPAFTFS